MQEDIEPLPECLWFERIELIARREFSSTEHALRHAMHLLQLTPRQFRPPEYQALDEAHFEALLGAGDFEAAARRLVTAPTLSLSATTAAGRVKVAVRCSRLNKTLLGEGDSVADAILQAWSECLLMLKEAGPTWLRANEL